MRIFSNLAISLDGKIATRSKKLVLLGTQEDHKEMQRLRKQADSILIGASTLRSFKKPNLVFGTKKQPINAILSSQLEGISPRWPFFQEPNLKRVLFVHPKTPVNRLKRFEKSSELIILRPPAPKRSAAIQIAQWFDSQGTKNLLIEGGGGVMWDFTQARLIQEYHVTLTPQLIGGALAPSLVDGAGFLPKHILKLKLKQYRVTQDEIFLIYVPAQNP